MKEVRKRERERENNKINVRKQMFMDKDILTVKVQNQQVSYKYIQSTTNRYK